MMLAELCSFFKDPTERSASYLIPCLSSSYRPSAFLGSWDPSSILKASSVELRPSHSHILPLLPSSTFMNASDYNGPPG